MTSRALLALVVVLLAAGASGQDGASVPPLSAPGTSAPGASAMELFEQAEAAARDAGGDRVKRAEAIRLYVEAFEAARSSPAAEGEFSVAASACLGIAQLEPSEQRRKWLGALAQRLDARYAPRPWLDASLQPDRRALRERLARAVADVRAGRGDRALEALGDPSLEAAAERLAPALESAESPASLDRLRTLAREYERQACAGARFVAQGRGNTRTFVLCPDNNGDPGPPLSIAERIDYLRFEALMLDAEPRSWTGELAAGTPGPLLDPDPSELAPTYGLASRPSTQERDAATEQPGADNG